MSGIVTKLDSVITQLADLADNPAFPYRTAVIWLSSLQTAWELYVDRRQVPKFSIPFPPPELKDHLKKDTFKKAQSYGRDKLNYSIAHTVYSFAVGLAFVYFGVFASTWDSVARFMARVGIASSRTIVHSLLWMSYLTILPAIPGLAWSYYYNFVLEQKHGFNKSTVKLFITDTLKTWLLTAVIGLPVLAGFLKIIDIAGKNFVAWLMLFLLGIQLILQIIFPIFIQPLFNKFTPVPEGDLRNRVVALATKLKFPLTHLYVIDGSKRSSHSNAYFYGLPWSKRIVIYDTLIKESTPAEVEAVLAHELGHWYLSHPTRLILIAQGHLLFTLFIFSIFIHNKALFEAFGFDPRLAVSSPTGGSQPVVIGFILYQLLFEPLDTVVKFFMNSKTRQYEYEADAFAVRLGFRKELGDALIKLHVNNLSAPHSDKLYSAYHRSHPTLPERLRAMDEYTGASWLKLSPKAKKQEIEEQHKKED
ncbi:putative CAAX prenyl protease 1 [Vanrija pseudolonga]|uniref:CAAX prenyl protease n=1 Tax=Vanrija pseudolonga TaxID=143232 RepID=A0AAF1BFI5_9TREE|nr:putative CAAX prenyl protease 1 [Vanrija pseudolonga]